MSWQFDNLCFGSNSNPLVYYEVIFCTCKNPINCFFSRLLTYIFVKSLFAADCKLLEVSALTQNHSTSFSPSLFPHPLGNVPSLLCSDCYLLGDSSGRGPSVAIQNHWPICPDSLPTYVCHQQWIVKFMNCVSTRLSTLRLTSSSIKSSHKCCRPPQSFQDQSQ